MKIGIYNPYLNALGGGERYCLDIASCLSSEHDVDLFWDDPAILKNAAKRFRMDLGRIRVAPNIINGSPLSRRPTTKGYDVLFLVSDGSIPWIFSKKAYLIFQFPIPWVKTGTILTRLKMRNITGLICYSEFVKKHIASSFGKPVHVVAPCVDTDAFVPARKKENIILSVGRFTTGMNTKKQSVLIGAFKKLHDAGLNTWSLVLAGGALESDASFIESLKEEAKHYPIRIIPNIAFDDLQSLYGKAKIYWHAAGFGEDLAKHPEYAEHFGLTTLEAMSAGAVPVVFAAGGQKEVVGNWVNGFFWEKEEDLRSSTTRLADNIKTWTRMSQAAQAHAKTYSKQAFCSKIGALAYA